MSLSFKSLVSLLLALLVATVTAQAALFPPKGPVINLSGRDFKKTLSDGATCMVSFTAPWCGHCKTLTPEFIKAAESLSPLIPFYNVDCDAEENERLCAEYGVQGFPTIKAFPKGSKSVPRDYQGERKAGGLVSYAASLVPIEKVHKLKSISEVKESFLSEKPSIAHVLLLHPATPTVPLMWKVLSSRFDGKIHFGFMKDADGSARKTLGATDGDGVKIVTWTKDGGKPEVYTAGPLKFEPLLEHFKTMIGETDSISSATSSSSSSSSSSPSSSSTTASAATSPESNKLDAAARAALKRKELQEKWEEEERRDRIRREKREADRLARQLSEQDRLSDDENTEEERKLKEEPTVVDVELPRAAQVADQKSGPLNPSSGSPAEAGTPPDAQEEAAAINDLIAEFEKVTVPAVTGTGKTVVDRETSAGTPLEEEADVFEHGQHTKDGEEVKDGHVRDEL